MGKSQVPFQQEKNVSKSSAWGKVIPNTGGKDRKGKFISRTGKL
jgi:hypothetical protein